MAHRLIRLLLSTLLAAAAMAIIAGPRAGAGPRAAAEEATASVVYLPAAFHHACDFPVVDDFTDDASGWPERATALSVSQYRTEAYQYQIFFHRAGVWTAVTRGDWWDRAVVAHIAGNIVEDSGYLGIVFGLNEDWSDFHTFEYDQDSRGWGVFRYHREAWETLQTGKMSITQVHPPYELELRSEGERIELWLEGYRVHEIPQVAGRIGLSGASYEAGTDIRFADYLFAARGCFDPRVAAAQAETAPPLPPSPLMRPAP